MSCWPPWSARTPSSCVWLVREAVTHHVLGVDEASGAYVFRHALVQEAIYDDLLPIQPARCTPPTPGRWSNDRAARRRRGAS